MARVYVSPDILRWAAYRSGKSEIIHEKFPNWTKWIKNESQPTFKQLETVAKATATPLGYFFLKEPPVQRLSIPHFRTIDNSRTFNPSPNLLDTVHMMERRQEWLRKYYIEKGYEPLPFVGTKSFKDDPKEVAKEIKEVLGLRNGWAAKCKTWQEALRMLFYLTDAAGIFLVVNGIVGNNTHRKLDINEFRGFVLVDEYAPIIFINGADFKAAKMFTLAHELAHVWYGVSAAFDLQKLQPADNEIEHVCNMVAAEFLVPENELQEIWLKHRKKDDRFQLLARHFKVSEIVVARRALDLTLINKDEFLDFYQHRVTNEKNNVDSSGGDFYATQTFRIGRRFAETVIRATREGKLLYSEAYRLTGLKGKTFNEYAERLGFGGDA